MIAFAGTIIADVYLSGHSAVLEHDAAYAFLTHRVFPGGKAANQAVCASAFGEDALLFARVGDDENGRLCLLNLEQAGVDTSSVVIDPLYPTGFVALVPVDGDTVSAVVSYGASHRLSELDLEKHEKKLFEASILVTGIEINKQLVAELIKRAKERDLTVILDPYPPEKADIDLFTMADIITPNRDEGSVISGREIRSVFAAKLAVADMLKSGVKNICLKLGESGIVVGSGDDIVHIPPVKVQPVDATGGGDVFAAVLSVFLNRGNSLIDSATIANYASALSVTREGAFSSIPKPRELLEFMIHREAEEKYISPVENLIQELESR